jgi:PA domain
MRTLRLFVAAAAGALALAGGAAADPDDPVDDGVVEAGQHGGTGGHLPPSSLNVELVGKLRVSDAAPGIISDVGSFRNYAYLGQFQPGCTADGAGGVYVIDILNPSSPREVGFIASRPGSYVGEGVHIIHVDTAAFTGDILATNQEPCNPTTPAPGSGGFSLYDVTNPLAAVPLVLNFGDETTPSGGHSDVHHTHSVFMWQQAGKAYLVGTDNDEQGIKDVDIFDITDPRNPRLISEVGLPDWPGAVVNGFGSRSFNHDMVVEKIGATWTLLSSYWDAGYVKLNVNDPANPRFIDDSDFSSPDPEFPAFEVPEGNGHYAEFDRRGSFIIGTDEDFGPFRTELRIQTGPNVGSFPATEGAASRRLATLPDQAMNDGTTYLGFGCSTAGLPTAVEDGDPNTEEIAVIQRGPLPPGVACTFQQKFDTAQALGYDGVIVFNHEVGGESLVTMAVTSNLPGIFVGRSTGQKIFGDVIPAEGTTGEQVRATSRFDGWGYIHLFDARTLREIDTYAVPETKLEENASGAGTMSVHEVTFDRNSNLAYLAWYDAGFRVVSYGSAGLQEVGHFIDEGGNDFWGVQLPTTLQGEDLVLASDRDFGLYVLRYTGPQP